MDEEQNIPWAILFGIAGFVDLLAYLITPVTLIPFVGWILGPLAGGMLSIVTGFSFWLYFLTKGHNFWKGGLGTTIVELIPFLNMLPTWTAYITGAFLKIKSMQLPAGQKLGFATKIANKII